MTISVHNIRNCEECHGYFDFELEKNMFGGIFKNFSPKKCLGARHKILEGRIIAPLPPLPVSCPWKARKKGKIWNQAPCTNPCCIFVVYGTHCELEFTFQGFGMIPVSVCLWWIDCLPKIKYVVACCSFLNRHSKELLFGGMGVLYSVYSLFVFVFF